MRVRLISLALGLALAAPAFADTSTSLGVFQNWTAYSNGDGTQKVCYALSQPKSSAPKKKRDKIYFLVSDWPGRHIKGEIEIVPGFSYKDGSDVTIQIGAQKFPLFTKNEGDAGSAWVKDPAQENAMIQALRGASTVTVTGVSSRGTSIKDTYSLSGFGDALDKAHTACSS